MMTASAPRGRSRGSCHPPRAHAARRRARGAARERPRRRAADRTGATGAPESSPARGPHPTSASVEIPEKSKAPATAADSTLLTAVVRRRRRPTRRSASRTSRRRSRRRRARSQAAVRTLWSASAPRRPRRRVPGEARVAAERPRHVGAQELPRWREREDSPLALLENARRSRARASVGTSRRHACPLARDLATRPSPVLRRSAIPTRRRRRRPASPTCHQLQQLEVGREPAG